MFRQRTIGRKLMDEMTQQNAALVEEAAAASESVDIQARRLWHLMEFFKVDARVKEQQPPMAAAALPDVAPFSVQHDQESRTPAATGRSVAAARSSH